MQIGKVFVIALCCWLYGSLGIGIAEDSPLLSGFSMDDCGLNPKCGVAWYTHEMLVLEDMLQENPDDEELIGHYLLAALNVVFYGRQAALWDYLYNPETEILDLGFEQEDLEQQVYCWPKNPYNDWEPMRLVQDPSEFSPGDLLIVACPPEYYTTMYGVKNDIKVSESFQIFLCGIEPSPQDTELYFENPDLQVSWVDPPDGFLHFAAVLAQP